MREASTRSVDVYIASVRDQNEEHPVGGAGPIDHRSMPTEMVL